MQISLIHRSHVKPEHGGPYWACKVDGITWGTGRTPSDARRAARQAVRSEWASSRRVRWFNDARRWALMYGLLRR